MMGRNDANAERADEERFTFTVNGDGTVSVRNESYVVASDHVYEVTVQDGFVTDCTCPHRQHRGERCKHMIVVNNEVLPSLPDDYGAHNDDDRDDDIESIDLTASERRDIRGALANEMTDALNAECEDDAERLRALRARFTE